MRGVLGREGFQNLSPEEATRFALPCGDRAEPPGGDDCARSRDCGGFRRVAPQAIQHESVAYFERCGLLGDKLVFTVVRNPFVRALSEIDTYLPEAPFAAPAFVANGWLRQDGMAYFYDEGLLLEVLHEAGFGQATRMPPGTGSRPELCGLEPDQITGTFHPFDRLSKP